jgi:hypothetical protein
MRASVPRSTIVLLVATCALLGGCTNARARSAPRPPTAPAPPSAPVSSATLAAVTPTDAAASQAASAAICRAGAPPGNTVVASYAVPVSQLTAMHGGLPPGIYPYASGLSEVSPFAVTGWCEFKGNGVYFASIVDPSGRLLNQIIGYGPSPTFFPLPPTGPYPQP